jgi:hypothetical protein
MKTIKVRWNSEIPEGFTGVVEHSDGEKVWYLNGQYHREDGPAREWADGEKQWRLNGQRHRVDGPAIERSDGTKHWYLNGQYHREDGPAYEGPNGTKQWWLNDQLHREDGPAIEWANGTKEWYLNHKRIYRLERIRDYILIEDGLPSEVEWLGKRVTQRKLLTATGFMYIPNLPGI